MTVAVKEVERRIRKFIKWYRRHLIGNDKIVVDYHSNYCDIYHNTERGNNVGFYRVYSDGTFIFNESSYFVSVLNKADSLFERLENEDFE